MTIDPGTHLGPYEITAKLGEGGMGEVYRATDTKLEREVAIKVLPAAFTEDEERLARFEREAKLLAQLHHPNIASIFGLEESGTTRALAMELVEGPTLAERLEQGALPLEESLEIARQIAEALEEAHDKGIVHRDLKPQNVKVTADGRVKVLDFGLAKAMDPTGASDARSAPQLSHSPTLTLGATVQGMVLGTAAYMAPEQAKGFAVDKRVDVWAFGVVLSEMLTGGSLFAGDSVGDTLAAVIRAEIDLDRLPAATPPAIRRLLRRCLERNPKNRLHDVADARIVIQEVVDGSILEAAAAATASPARTRLARWVLAGSALVAVAGIAAWLGRSLGSEPAATSRPPVHFDFSIPAADPEIEFQRPAVAFSPDGRTIVITGTAREDDTGALTQLYLRRLDRDAAEPIPGTEGADGPCFSPDGASIAYAQGDAVWKLRLQGGAPVRVAPVRGGWRGATWGPDGTIVYAPSWFSPLFLIPPGGGEPRPLTELAPGEKSHRYPQFLPDGSAVLFVSSTSKTESFDESNVEVVSLGTGERKVLLEGGGGPRFLPPSTLLVPRTGRLLAVPFDPRRLKLTGPPVVVRENMVTSPTYGSPTFDVTPTGDLVDFPGGADLFSSRVVLVSRDGTVSPTTAPLRTTTRVRYSPDGSELLMRLDAANGQVWVFDVERGTMTRITGDWDADYPVWSRDGENVYYTLTEGARSWLARTRSDGTGEVEKLWELHSPGHLEMARDGSKLLFGDRGESTGQDLYWVDPQGSDPPQLYLGTASNEWQPALSPDGRWLAYASDASGRPEVYVQSFPVPGRRTQVSARGGTAPFWSEDGRELFFRSGRDVQVAEVTTANGFEAGRARRLFTVDDVEKAGGSPMGLGPRGEGFVTLARDPDWQPADRLRVTLGWRQELERQLAGGGADP